MSESTSPTSHSHFRKGILLILTAWLFFALLSPLVRQVSQHLPMVDILCMQGVIGLIGVMPWMLKHGVESLKTKSWKLVLFRAICGILNYACLFLAITHTSLVDAFLLNNSAPLFIPFVVFIWLKLPIEHKLWPGLIGGFIGIILILKPGAEVLSFGAIYGVAMGILTALAMVSLRLLSFTTRNHTVLFYYFLLSALITLPLVIYYGKYPEGIAWVKLIGIGILSTLAQVTMTRAFHYAKPTALGPFNYCAVIYGGLLDWFLYGVKPDLLSWIGIVLICLGGIWAIRYNRQISSPRSS